MFHFSKLLLVLMARAANWRTRFHLLFYLPLDRLAVAATDKGGGGGGGLRPVAGSRSNRGWRMVLASRSGSEEGLKEAEGGQQWPDMDWRVADEGSWEALACKRRQTEIDR